MKTIIDETAGTITVIDGATSVTHSLASREGFRAAARAWIRATWDAKYVYAQTWLGRPIIQLPDDMVRTQELICALRPDVIVETGVAHGGSLVFYASLFEMMGTTGRVIGVDIEIRPHNRAALEAHPLMRRIDLIEGSSTDPAIVARVRAQIPTNASVMVVLDSDHTRDHVLAELGAYADIVTPGQYMLATDGLMAFLDGAPRSKPDWAWNNPREAARLFVAADARFVAEEPAWPFNEGVAADRVTYWPNSHLRRVR